LDELRRKERKILNKRRQDTSEQIRPPVDKWWELKTSQFNNEILRNRMHVGPNANEIMDTYNRCQVYDI